MKTENEYYKNNDPKKKTIYESMDEFIKSKYDLRLNTISPKYEIRLIGRDAWKVLEIESLLIELEGQGITCSISKLEIYLKSWFVEKYNPIQDYFRTLPEWDQSRDYIAEYASYVPLLEPERFVYHLKKWLVRAIKCSLQEGYINKQCLLLVHAGQNSGKSTWCRDLCPDGLKNYYTEDIGHGKDANIQLANNFIVAFDDFDGESKSDLGVKKAMMSKSFINERLPYDRTNSQLARICSFIGSTNQGTFLKDDTGSVRWLPFEMNGVINFNYKNEMNIDDIWSQAYYLAYYDKSFDASITIEDIREIERKNGKYRELSPEEEIITEYYEPSNDMVDFKTATQIVKDLSDLKLRLSSVNMGKALTAKKFRRVKNSKKDCYGYLAKQLFDNSPMEV